MKLLLIVTFLGAPLPGQPAAVPGIPYRLAVETHGKALSWAECEGELRRWREAFANDPAGKHMQVERAECVSDAKAKRSHRRRRR